MTTIEIKPTSMNHETALNENLEYCNELAERINLLVETILALDKRVKILEER